MQTHSDVSVLRALFVMTETFDSEDLSQMLQFHPGKRVDMSAARL
jgi:hypothetical protein